MRSGKYIFERGLRDSTIAREAPYLGRLAPPTANDDEDDRREAIEEERLEPDLARLASLR